MTNTLVLSLYNAAAATIVPMRGVETGQKLSAPNRPSRAHGRTVRLEAHSRAARSHSRNPLI